MTGFSAGSETLKLAGERGYLPMSLDLNTEYVASHRDAVLEGARLDRAHPDRKDWRLVREVVVAETDEQAFRYAVDGMMGRNMREYVLPTFRMFGMTKFYKAQPGGSRRGTSRRNTSRRTPSWSGRSRRWSTNSKPPTTRSVGSDTC